jgi:hypothetical protein
MVPARLWLCRSLDCLGGSKPRSKLLDRRPGHVHRFLTESLDYSYKLASQQWINDIIALELANLCRVKFYFYYTSRGGTILR